MKLPKKVIPIILLAFLTLMAGCSKDDDVSENPSGQNPDRMDTPFTFSEIYQKDLSLPARLNQSSDPQAKGLVENYEEVIGFQDDRDIADVPPGAKVSHEPVKTNTNSARDFGDTDYTVYTYSDAGITLYYQFSVQNNQDVFELYQESAELGLLKMYELRQSMDGSSGTASFFIFGAAVTYTWEIKADGSIFMTMTSGSENFRGYYETTLFPDGSGYLTYSFNDELQMEYAWNSDGSGTWNDHTEDKNGSWD